MKYFTVDQKGNIVSSGDCPESMVSAQAVDGNVVFKGSADPRTQRYNHSTGQLEDCGVHADVLATETRGERNILLAATDWIELPSNASHPSYASIMQYRANVKNECRLAIAENRHAKFPNFPSKA